MNKSVVDEKIVGKLLPRGNKSQFTEIDRLLDKYGVEWRGVDTSHGTRLYVILSTENLPTDQFGPYLPTSPDSGFSLDVDIRDILEDILGPKWNMDPIFLSLKKEKSMQSMEVTKQAIPELNRKIEELQSEIFELSLEEIPRRLPLLKSQLEVLERLREVRLNLP